MREDTRQNTLLLSEQVRLLYGGLPLAIVMSGLIAGLQVVVMWPVVSQNLNLGWLTLMLIVTLVRVGIYFLNKLKRESQTDLFWLILFRVSVFMVGLVWGVAGLMLFPTGNISYQVFLAFVMAGVSSAASSSLASDRISALGFIVPTLIPLVWNFSREGGVMPLSMELMTVFFLIFLFAAASRTQKNLVEFISLRAKSIEQEEALRESEQHVRYIIDTCPTAARIAKSDGHEVVFFNASYVKLINAATSEVNGIDPATYYANQHDYAEILQQLGRGEKVMERLVELKIPHDPSAGNKWALATFLPTYYHGVPAVLGWFHDITERIRAERIKSEFVSTVSHELRTPLTAIMGALGLLMGGVMGPLSEQAKEMISIAHKNSQHLTFLINDLLDMEKLVAGKMVFDMQKHLLCKLVEQSLEENRTFGTGRRVTLTFNDGSQNAHVNVDKQRFLQVLSNLLSNAIKYSPSDGVVAINITVSGAQARLAVSDSGPGIPKEFRTRIFQKFSQADSSDTRQNGGTGLGLAITKELVNRMKGVIGFESVEGEGANFYVEFPIVA